MDSQQVHAAIRAVQTAIAVKNRNFYAKREHYAVYEKNEEPLETTPLSSKKDPHCEANHSGQLKQQPGLKSKTPTDSSKNAEMDKLKAENNTLRKQNEMLVSVNSQRRRESRMLKQKNEQSNLLDSECDLRKEAEMLRAKANSKCASTKLENMKLRKQLETDLVRVLTRTSSQIHGIMSGSDTGNFFCKCGIKFETKKILNRHIRKKSLGKIFSCDYEICDKKYVNYEDLKKHCINVHNMHLEGLSCGKCGVIRIQNSDLLEKHNEICHSK